MNRNLDRDGQPITALQADTLLADRDYRTIDATQAGSLHVVTEWTATGPDIDGSPAIYTTRVYGEEYDDQYTRYYTSLSAARTGHDETVAKVSTA